MSMNELMLNFLGCYKGQETISRLITYDGVKQRLWGICLSDNAQPGSPITVDGKKVAVILNTMFQQFKKVPEGKKKRNMKVCSVLYATYFYFYFL